MKRTLIKIDEDLCNGCGVCVKSCHEGALQIIEGKARIIDDQYCDGLGACIGTCPEGAIIMEEREAEPYNEYAHYSVFPEPRQWPLQLHLINPSALRSKTGNLVLAADCTAFAYRDFHQHFIQNNRIAIACPKLDHSKDIYVEKITEMIDNSFFNTLIVIIMDVPCCGGLLQIAREAQANAKRKIPIKKIVIGIKGNLLYSE